MPDEKKSITVKHLLTHTSGMLRRKFPDGSIGHDGWTGQSFYLNRELELYVILLTDANCCSVRKHGISHYDEVCELRADIHRAIKKDLGL